MVQEVGAGIVKKVTSGDIVAMMDRPIKGSFIRGKDMEEVFRFRREVRMMESGNKECMQVKRGSLVGNNLFLGDGIYLYANGDMYEGGFKNGKFNGFGKYTVNSSGQFVEGEFKDGKPVHVGVETKKQEVSDVLDKQKIEQWKEQNQKIIEERKKHRRSVEGLKP